MLEKKDLPEEQLHKSISEEPQVAMEKAHFNKSLKEVAELIKRYSHSDNPLHQEWSRVYKLFYQRSSSDITPETLLKIVQYHTSESSELFIAYRILHAYACYDLDEYGILLNVCKTLIEEIKKIEGNPIESFYQYRISQLLANLYLSQNNVEQAREHAQFIIDNCLKVSYVASAYHTLGLSYLYEDYEKGMSALEKGLMITQDYKIQNHMVEIRRGIFFFNNYWGIDGKYILFTNQNKDWNERAHFEVKVGSKEKGKVILERIDEHSLTLREQGYFYYYKGLAIDSIELLYKSIMAFNQSENKFAAHMVRLELYRRGEPEATVEAAYS